MFEGERSTGAVAFVWRCPGCASVYEAGSLVFLPTDGTHGYCSCGSRLVEGVEAVSERRYRLVIPEALRGSQLHRQLERRTADGNVEVEVGRRGERHINLFDYGD
jgi:hypothetical protein